MSCLTARYILQINLVIQRMQIVISNIISDPGGSLLLSGSITGNAIIAVQQYVSYLRDPGLIGSQDIMDIVRTVDKARMTLKDQYRGIPGTELLYSLLDEIVTLEQQGLNLPPLRAFQPPPPPLRTSPPPPASDPSPPPPPPGVSELSR